jgi:hypothetical protein
VCSDDRVLVMPPDGPGFVDAFAGAMQEGQYHCGLGGRLGMWAVALRLR